MVSVFDRPGKGMVRPLSVTCWFGFRPIRLGSFTKLLVFEQLPVTPKPLSTDVTRFGGNDAANSSPARR